MHGVGYTSQLASNAAIFVVNISLGATTNHCIRLPPNSTSFSRVSATFGLRGGYYEIAVWCSIFIGVLSLTFSESRLRTKIVGILILSFVFSRWALLPRLLAINITA